MTVTGDLVPESGGLATTLLKDVIAELRQQDVVERIVFVLQVDGVEDSDRAATYQFVDALKWKECAILDKDLNVDDLLHVYGGARCVVGMRLHSTILGLVARTPALPLDLGHSHKVRAVFAEFGLEDLVLPVTEPAVALQVVRNVVQHGDMRRRIDEAMNVARDRLLEAEKGFTLH